MNEPGHDENTYRERLEELALEQVVRAAEGFLTPPPQPPQEVPVQQPLLPAPPPTMQPPRQEPPRRRSVLPVVFGVVLVVLLIAVVAMATLLLRDTDVASPTPTQPPPPPQTTQPAQTTAPSSTVASSTPARTSSVPVRTAQQVELKMTAPGLGDSAWIDIDKQRAFQAVSYAKDKIKGADLQLNDDGELTMLFAGDFAKAGHGPAGDLTEEQCRTAVDRQPLGTNETPEAGQNLCIVSNEGAVAWLKLTKLTDPGWAGHPSLVFQVTVWQ